MTNRVLKISLALFFIFQFALFSQSKSPAEYVNPYIGTSNGGNTFPGAVVPWGMVSVSPHTNSGGPGGYQYGKEFIYGFGHIHLSGVGCPEMGSIILTPATRELDPEPEKNKSHFRNETAYPGYYKAELTDNNIIAEMSATERTGISKYTLTSDDSEMSLIADVSRCLNGIKGGRVKINNSSEIEGYSIFGGFCGDEFKQKVYFVMQFNHSSSSIKLWEDKKYTDLRVLEKEGKAIGAYLRFKIKKNESLLVRTGISYVSVENARLNLESELSDWNFEGIKSRAKEKWNEQLSRIIVEGKNENYKTIFYTGMYHMLIHPNIFSDVNGQYRAMETGEVKKAEGYTRYTVYSLWDTYRNLHSFLTLVFPEKELDMVKSMIGMYEDYGWLPKWELTGKETYMMVGLPSLPVITDTYIKGIKNFNVDIAYEAMKKMSTAPAERQFPLRPGISQLMKYGYIPQDDTTDDTWGPVSTSLEYYFADWTLSQLARKLGREEDYNYFYNRSLYYKNYYDSTVEFLRPRNKDGSWLTPFDPLAMEGSGTWSGAGGPGYVEGNAWQYMFFVHHDVKGMISLYGGKYKFFKRLKQLFDENHFILWNEPDMGFPYLFEFIQGEEYRTQEIVKDLLNKYYNAAPGGLPGNDDTGVTSGWFVFSSMGFYPFCPGDSKYQAAFPLFDKITINLNKNFYTGSHIVIKTEDNNPDNTRIESIKFNGIPVKNYAIDHLEMVKGSEIIFELGK
ncbi:MAG: GH92 family glycosyl hydrolase [Bacillota bacterium]